MDLISGAGGSLIQEIANPEATFDLLFGTGAAAVPDQDGDGLPDLVVAGLEIVAAPTAEEPEATGLRWRWWVMSTGTAEAIRLGVGMVGAPGCEILLPAPPGETVDEFWWSNSVAGEDFILPGLPGDLDADGDVDEDDAVALVGQWTSGPTGSGGRLGDLTGDGTVNGADLAVLFGQFGWPAEFAEGFEGADDPAGVVAVAMRRRDQPDLNWNSPWHGGGGGTPGTGPMCPMKFCRAPGGGGAHAGAEGGDEGGTGCGTSCSCNPCDPACGGSPCAPPCGSQCSPGCGDPCAPPCGDPCGPGCDPCGALCSSRDCLPPECIADCDAFPDQCRACESECLPCDPSCDSSGSYFVELALESAIIEPDSLSDRDPPSARFAYVAWANDDDDDLDGKPDYMEGRAGVPDSCDGEDDFIRIWIGGSYCGAQHEWSIAAYTHWASNYVDPVGSSHLRYNAEPAGRFWYRVDLEGLVDLLWSNAAEPRWRVDLAPEKLIDGVRYRALPTMPGFANAEQPPALHPFVARYAINGDPRDWADMLYFEPFPRPRRPEAVWSSTRVVLTVSSMNPGGRTYVAGGIHGLFVGAEALDLQGWGPTLGANGNPGLTIHDFDSEGVPTRDWRVGGAITDGASLVLFRYLTPETPWYHDPDLVSPLIVRMTKRGPSRDNDYLTVGPQVAGSLYAPNPTSLPPIPVPGSANAQTWIQMTGDKAFYLPPDSYLDPAHTSGGEANSHNSEEVCRMSMIGTLPNGHRLVGGRSFALRRPPIVLVHGILSDPDVWDTTLWNEVGSPVPTRLYKVDYSATNMKGFSENYPALVSMINKAIQEYRSSDDEGHFAGRGFHGIRYAATRADVVGHSQGGQLARWYIADTSAFGVAVPRGGGWQLAIDNFRAIGDSGFRWPYLRPDNWGAGSVRRLITLNSPFRGSPIAGGLSSNAVAPTLRLSNFVAKRTIGGDPITSQLVDSLQASLEPTCLADLAPGSLAYAMLRSAQYPSSFRRLYWHPVASRVRDTLGFDPPEEWRYTSSIERLATSTATNASQLVRADNSDWVVSVCSQWNLPEIQPGPCQSDVRSLFMGMPHSSIRFGGVLRMKGPTAAPEVRDLVQSLLSSPLDARFDSTWSLGQ